MVRAFAAALLCRRDAIVEPRLVPGAVRDYLLASSPRSGPGYAWKPGREAVELAPHAVRDHTGDWHRGDLVVLCTGAAHTGIAGPHLAGYELPPVRRVRLQMLQTEPFGRQLTTSVADGDSLRYYPAYDLPGRAGPGSRRSVRPPRPPARSCCWHSGLMAASRSATRTPTTSRSPSTSTRRPTLTCAPGLSSCSGRRCRRRGGGGPACTAR